LATARWPSLSLPTRPRPAASSSRSLHDALPIFLAHADAVAHDLLELLLEHQELFLDLLLALLREPGEVLVREHLAVADRGERERSEEHTSELQSREKLVCRLLLEKKRLTREPIP